MRPLVKICCIANPAEAELAVAHGAGALGLVSAMPSGPGVIDEATVAEVAAWAARHAPQVQTFLLTAQTTAQGIVAQHQRCQTTTLQLVDALAPDELPALRQALPGVQLVQVVHVTGEASLDQARDVAPWVDAVLLDSGNPAASVKELGGTGRTHDWGISRRIRETLTQLGRPVWLAGGLNPGNVVEAVRQVQPHGLDLCSRVRRDGRLDAALLGQFFTALGQAGAD